jgi:hypothetical protein
MCLRFRPADVSRRSCRADEKIALALPASAWTS